MVKYKNNSKICKNKPFINFDIPIIFDHFKGSVLKLSTFLSCLEKNDRIVFYALCF